MDRSLKHGLIITLSGVCLFVALMNFTSVLIFLSGIVRLVLPVIVGAILALFVSVPMNGIEKWLGRIFSLRKNRLSDRKLHTMSFVLTLLCVLFLLILVLVLLVPEIASSIQSVYAQLREELPQWLEYLESHDMDKPWIRELISGIDIDRLIKSSPGGLDTVISNIADVLSGAFRIIMNAAFGFIICIYISLSRRQLGEHVKKLIRAYLREDIAEGFMHFCIVAHKSFSSFLSGQCLEAMILGMLMLLAFSIFRLPYAALVGLLTAVCAIIPYVGAFISCSVSVLLALLVGPEVALRCLLVYLAVQFVENQFIYPRVVGSSVGMPPLYTLIAAMLGAKLFGIIGIIFFIPLAAVAAELIREDAEKRLDDSGKERENT